jgi:ABC-2 type transport system ATP-binding protein
VDKGEVFALLGTNGAGKTTIIKTLMGLIKPNSGKIKIPSGLTIGYSPETPYFHSFLNAKEILKFYGKLQNIPNSVLNVEIENVLNLTGLKTNEYKKVKSYSKGMIQRLALAQSLLGSPDILILDEPCAGLDAVGRKHMIELIKNLKKDGKTIILNSHILADVEEVADRGIIIKNGKLVYEISAENIKNGELQNIFLKSVGDDLND